MKDEPCLSLLEAKPIRNDWPAVGNELRLKLRVANLAPEKWVGIRYSWDGWTTAWWLEASYAGPWPEAEGLDGPTELWEACLLVPLDRQAIDFALCCRMGGREWWDNQHGENFRAIIPPSVDQR